MTDGQLCAFLDEIQEKNTGCGLNKFFEKLEELKGTGNGIGTGTIYKLKKIAKANGFITEV